MYFLFQFFFTEHVESTVNGRATRRGGVCVTKNSTVDTGMEQGQTTGMNYCCTVHILFVSIFFTEPVESTVNGRATRRGVTKKATVDTGTKQGQTTGMNYGCTVHVACAFGFNEPVESSVNRRATRRGVTKEAADDPCKLYTKLY